MFARTLLVLTLGFSLAASAAPADDVNALLKSMETAFNKGDAKAAAALFAEDADLINPAGVAGRGRPAIEKVIGTDMTTVLKSSKNQKFTAEMVRELAPTAWLVDATHEVPTMAMPDGTTKPGKLHVIFAVNKGKDGKLQVVSARPYMYMPPPTATGMGK